MRATADEQGKAHVQILTGFTHLDRDDVEAARRAALEAVGLREGINDETHDGTLGIALDLLFGTEPIPAEAHPPGRGARAGRQPRGLARLWEHCAFRALLRGDLDEARDVIARSLAGENNDLAESVTAHAVFGVAWRSSGDDEDARLQFRAALAGYGTRGITPGLSGGLLALATCAARDGEDARAGRLVGAATAVRSRRAKPDRLEERLEAGARAIAQERCDPVVWGRAVDAGLRLTPPERIELGLEAARAGL